MAFTKDIWTTLVLGTKDEDSVLSCLRGVPHILRLIFQLVINDRRWKKCIQLPDVHLEGEQWETFNSSTKKTGKDSFLFLTQVLGRFQFESSRLSIQSTTFSSYSTNKSINLLTNQFLNQTIISRSANLSIIQFTNLLINLFTRTAVY